MKKPRPTAVCPNCGTTFPSGKLACPECGSDALTGWKSHDEIDYESVDIPDSWDEEPPRAGPIPAKAMWAVTILLVVALVLWFVFGM